MDWQYKHVRGPDNGLTEDPEWLHDAKVLADLPADEFLAMTEGLDWESQKELYRMRFRFDTEWFLRFFWPDAYELTFNKFQHWFLGRPKQFWRDRARENDDNVLRATAAPRGNAKTTLSTGMIIHDMAYGLEGFVVVVSASMDKGSTAMVNNVCAMIRDNELLEAFYGKAQIKPFQRDKQIRFGKNPWIGLAARSFTTQYRGIKFINQRPTKVLVDDGEDPLRVLNPQNRTKDFKFLNDDILKGGPPKGGMLMDWVGTVLHRAALLPNLLQSPGWEGTHWKAIEEWSRDEESLALWEECREIWADRANPDREKDARRFYKDNKEAMDRGWVVMDPTNWPIYRLHIAMWKEGIQSFLRERQNEPDVSQFAFFDVDQFATFTIEHDEEGQPFIPLESKRYGMLRSYLRDMAVVGYLDPIPGKDLGYLDAASNAGSGDYAAFAVVAKDRYGYAYVLDVWMGKARDSEQMAKVWELCERWRIPTVGVESNMFARLITRDFQRAQRERQMRGEYASVTFMEDHVQETKEERIAKLQPVLMDTKWLRMASHLMGEHSLLEQQFRDFPNAAHDDGPDAVASAFELLGGTPIESSGRKRHTRR